MSVLHLRILIVVCGREMRKYWANAEFLFISLVFRPATDFHSQATQQSGDCRRSIKERKLPSGVGGWTFTGKNRRGEKCFNRQKLLALHWRKTWGSSKGAFSWQVIKIKLTSSTRFTELKSSKFFLHINNILSQAYWACISGQMVSLESNLVQNKGLKLCKQQMFCSWLSFYIHEAKARRPSKPQEFLQVVSLAGGRSAICDMWQFRALVWDCPDCVMHGEAGEGASAMVASSSSKRGSEWWTALNLCCLFIFPSHGGWSE